MITEPLRKIAEKEAADNSQNIYDYQALNSAAEQWSAHALRTYSGKTLKRALAISQAFVAFSSIIENPK